MKRRLLYPAAGVLALAVSPLFAQQDDEPAAAEPATEQARQEAIDAARAALTDEDRAAILAFAQEVSDQIEAGQAENSAQTGGEVQAAAAMVQAVLDEEATAQEPADADAPGDEPELVEEAEIVELQPAQQGVVVQRAVVVRGNAANAQFIIGPGGFEQRQFNADLSGLPELVLGAVTDGVTTDADPSSYRFDAEGPGLLTVAVRAKEGDDMTIEVYGLGGQQLARCDIDFGGNTGAEHLAVPIPEAGSYRVVVEPLGNGGPFWMGASWLNFQELEALAPSRPEDAAQVTPGQAQQATLDGPDTWFTYTAPANGLLMFNTAADRGNLVIEAYYEGRFDQQVQYSDQNRNGRPGNERILMDLAEGQTIYFKVVGRGTGEDFEFNVSSRFIEDE